MQAFIDALIDILLWLPRKIYEWIVDAIEAMLAALPTVQIADIDALFNSVGGDILFFLTVMEMQYGLTVVLGALVARFILRRIPFIGG